MSGSEIQLYRSAEDREALIRYSKDLWDLKVSPVMSEEKRKTLSYEYLDVFKRNEQGFLNLFFEKTDRVAENTNSNMSPSWHLPSTGTLFSLNINPVFQLDINNYGIGYAPAQIDKFLECVNLGMAYQKFERKHKRGLDLQKYGLEDKNAFFFISEFYKYAVVDDPESIRDNLLRELISPDSKFSVEDTFNYVMIETKDEQKDMGFQLAHIKGTEKNIFNTVAYILSDDKKKVEENGKVVFTKVFDSESLSVISKHFKGNSRYFLMKASQFFLKHVKERVEMRKLELIKKNPEYKKVFPNVKAKFSDKFQNENDEYIPKNTITKSYSPRDLYDCIKSRGLGDISIFIDLVSELLDVNLRIFDNTFEKIIASGVSNNNRVVILRYTLEKSFELGGTFLNKDSIQKVKFLFIKGEDDIVDHINRIGLVKIES
jgi:hypothetical protein